MLIHCCLDREMFSRQGRQGICWSHWAAAQKCVKTACIGEMQRAVMLTSILAGKQWWSSSCLMPHLNSDQLQLPLTQMITGRSRGWGSVGGMNEYTEGHTEGRGCRVALRVHHIQVIDCARGEGILIRHARVMLMIIGGSRKQLETHALLQARMAPYLRREQSMHKQPLCPLNEDKQ